MVLQWDAQTNYAITELVFFLITCAVIFGTIVIGTIVLLMHRKNRTFFELLRPLFESVFTSAIAFTRKGHGNLKVVFLGHKEKGYEDVGPGRWKELVLRIWVHVYFTLLCGIVLLWFVSVLSDAVLYRKTTTCLDLNQRNMRCFLLRNDQDIPSGIQEILDNHEEDTVPCGKIEDYVIRTNTSYDISVICYQSQLNPLAALGVAYGVMKTIVFLLVISLHVFFTATRRLPHAGSRFVRIIVVSHAVQLSFSLAVSSIILAVVLSIHGANGSKNTSFDYLRGEPFLNCSIVALWTTTIVITFGFFPWWAFKPLEEAHPSPTESDEKLHESIDLMILHHQFSTYYSN